MPLLRNLTLIAATVACLVAVQVILAPVFSENANAVAHRSGIVALAHNGWVLDIHGHVWNSQPGECWTRRPEYDPPVQLAEIDLWDNHALVTIDGVL